MDQPLARDPDRSVLVLTVFLQFQSLDDYVLVAISVRSDKSPEGSSLYLLEGICRTHHESVDTGQLTLPFESQ